MHDVAIVGAGPVGLYLSSLLKGLDVVVLDRNKDIGKKADSGLYSRNLEKFIPMNQDWVEHKVTSARLHSPSGQEIELKKPSTAAYVVDREAFTKWLAGRSEAEIKLKTTVNSISITDRVSMNTSNGTIESKMVVGCDGANSIVRSHFGIRPKEMLNGIIGITEETNDDSFVDLFFDKECISDGFFWKIPRGSRVEYGIMEEQKVARGMLDEFCEKLGVKIEGLQAWPIPSGMIISDNPQVTLCGGDACGLTKPWSGGGVIWSLTAANILLRNFPDFNEYHKELKKFFGWQLFKTRAITKLGYILGNYAPWALPREREIDSDFILPVKI